jgi:hypothetical protein
MAQVVRIGQGRSKSGKILDRNTVWFNIDSKEAWERCIHEWSLKKNSGKPVYLSKNGRAYREISGVQLLRLGDTFKS